MTITLQTAAGVMTIDPQIPYDAAKCAFLADYSDDQAVVDKVYRHGDLMKSRYAEIISGLSPERCATAQPGDIEKCMYSSARLAIVEVTLLSSNRK